MLRRLRRGHFRVRGDMIDLSHYEDNGYRFEMWGSRLTDPSNHPLTVKCGRQET